MKDIGLLFNADMVRATLQDMKSETRRTRALDVINQHPDGYRFLNYGLDRGAVTVRFACIAAPGETISIRCPYGSAGTKLWGRETHFINDYRGANVPEEERADVELVYAATDMHYVRNLEDREGFAWRPSIHMPRWASRINLAVTDITIDRLNNMDHGDAFAEGVSIFGDDWLRKNYVDYMVAFDKAVMLKEKPPLGPSPLQRYSVLWDSINGAGSWDKNPWVWVVKFRRVAK